jgi:hypothetical protein
MINSGRRFCNAIHEPLSRRGATSAPARTPGSERCPAAEFADINFDSRLRTVRPNYAVSLAASWTKEPRAKEPVRSAHRRDPRRGATRRRERRRQPDPGYPPGRVKAKLQPRIARCYALGRGRQRPWVRAFVPTRTPSDRPDLHGRCRNSGTRPSQDRRSQFDQYGTAVPDTWICVRSAPPGTHSRRSCGRRGP